MAKAAPSFLGPEPRIENREDAARALEALVWLDGQADAADAALAKKVAKLKTESEDRLALQVGDSATTVGTYAQLLRAELQRWGLENESEFAEEKTLKFSHGSLGFRQGPPSIDAIGEMKTLTDRIRQVFTKPIEALLIGLGYLGVWRLELKPDLQEMGKAIKAGTLSRAELQKQGFRVVDGTKRIEVTVGVTTEKKPKGK